MSSFTCISCRVLFESADYQREHYKTDWHRYNLKRKLVELQPVTEDEFKLKVAFQTKKKDEQWNENNNNDKRNDKDNHKGKDNRKSELEKNGQEKEKYDKTFEEESEDDESDIDKELYNDNFDDCNDSD